MIGVRVNVCARSVRRGGVGSSSFVTLIGDRLVAARSIGSLAAVECARWKNTPVADMPERRVGRPWRRLLSQRVAGPSSGKSAAILQYGFSPFVFG